MSSSKSFQGPLTRDMRLLFISRVAFASIETKKLAEFQVSFELRSHGIEPHLAKSRNHNLSADE
jgi:hypothetical protein